MAKPTALKYKGTMVASAWDDKGNAIAHAPDQFYQGVPARDLDEEDIARLDAATLKLITGGEKPLYVDASPEPETEPAKPAETKPAEGKRER